MNTNKLYLPINEKHLCDIKAFSDKITFEGKFWYLKNKEFYRYHTYKEAAFLKTLLLWAILQNTLLKNVWYSYLVELHSKLSRL